jgi:predicted transcriptional regulator
VATTVHIPDRLLERVDARAKALGMSRNRLIVEALEDKLAPQAKWPPELVKLLSAPLDRELQAATRAMERAVARGRRSRKRPPRL